MRCEASYQMEYTMQGLEVSCKNVRVPQIHFPLSPFLGSLPTFSLRGQEFVIGK